LCNKKIKNEDLNHIHKLQINISISPQQPWLSYMPGTANSKFHNMTECSLFDLCKETGNLQNADRKAFVGSLATEIKNMNWYFGFEVLTAAVNMMISVFWVVMLCGLETTQQFGGTYCLHLQDKSVNQARNRQHS
jgi:hypothetical protein